MKELERVSDYVKYLSLVAVQRAQSGHPGLPLGCARIGVLLYAHHLSFNPEQPLWAGRDRFVLSAGHGSMLLYSLNYVFGYPISIADIARFRQIDSPTPGHPEYHPSLGIETTTGPLGQGIANSVGLALGAKMKASRMGGEEEHLMDYVVYCLAGDGCMMEGVSYESASLAGHLKLDNFILLYDSNRISIDGKTDLTFSEDVKKRFEAQGFWVDEVDSRNVDEFDVKMRKLRKLKGKPKLLIIFTVIGEGLDALKDSSAIHGSPAGLDEIVHFINHSTLKEAFSSDVRGDLSRQIETGNFLTKEALLGDLLDDFVSQKKKVYKEWNDSLENYQRRHPESASLMKETMAVSDDLRRYLLNYYRSGAATRDMLSEVLSEVAKHQPLLVGGSADLATSTKATVKQSTYVKASDFSGSNIAYGIREHGMGSINNGVALSGFLPFSSTFLSFVDYMKPSLRLASLMGLPHLFIFTHDSISVGEDGPTHQPIEQLISIRSIPGMRVFRASNGREVAFALLYYLENRRPVTLVATRQKIGKTEDGGVLKERWRYEDFLRGACEVVETDDPQCRFFATGSELWDALDIAEQLKRERGMRCSVVSITSMELFFESLGNPEGGKEWFLEKGHNILLENSSFFPYKIFFRKNVHVLDVDQFGLSGKEGDVKKRLGRDTSGYLKKIDEILLNAKYL